MDNLDNIKLTQFNHALDPQYCPHCQTYHNPNDMHDLIGLKELENKPTAYKLLYPGKVFKIAVFMCQVCFKYYWFHKIIR
jgi:hypothetical protein